MDQPLLDQRFHQPPEDQGWDKNKSIMTNRTFTIMKSF